MFAEVPWYTDPLLCNYWRADRCVESICPCITRCLFIYLFICLFILKQDLHMQPMLTLNSRCACPSLPSAEITDMLTTPRLHVFWTKDKCLEEKGTPTTYATVLNLGLKGSWNRSEGSIERDYMKFLLGVCWHPLQTHSCKCRCCAVGSWGHRPCPSANTSALHFIHSPQHLPTPTTRTQQG